MTRTHLRLIVLRYLEGGKMPRFKVTDRIKNYPTDLRRDVASSLVREGLVRIEKSDSPGRGRNPTYLSLTPKGVRYLDKHREDLEQLRNTKTIWA